MQPKYIKEFVDKTWPIVVCPICGKSFVPAPEHAWDIDYGRKLVCSYTCMRVWEKEHLAKTRKMIHRVRSKSKTDLDIALYSAKKRAEKQRKKK